MLSRKLEETRSRAYAHADQRRHKSLTCVHLLLALTEDEDAVAVMRACGVDLEALRHKVTHYLDTELQDLVRPTPEEIEKASGFKRIVAKTKNLVSPKEARMDFEVQRALQHALFIQKASESKLSEAGDITGANVLVSLFQPDSKAAALLRESGVSRFDAVRYISHGISKLSVEHATSAVASGEREALGASCTVRLLNDNYTPMDFVVYVLENFFAKKRQEATDLMLQIHRQGMAICGIYPCEEAATKVNLVMDYARKNEHPLQCTMERG